MTSESPDPQAILDRQRRANLIWLAVLVALIIGLMFLAGPLFNNYWDPHLSNQTISH